MVARADADAEAEAIREASNYGAGRFRRTGRVLAWQPFDRGVCYGGWEMKISLGFAVLALGVGMGMSAYAQGGREVQTTRFPTADHETGL